MASFSHPFDAFVSDGAEVLILGSFPSIKKVCFTGKTSQVQVQLTEL